MVDTVWGLVYALEVRRDGLARGGRTERRTGPQGQCREGRERGGGHNLDCRVTNSLEGASFPGCFVVCVEQTSSKQTSRRVQRTYSELVCCLRVCFVAV